MNPYEPPKTKVDDVLPNSGNYRYRAGESYRASVKLMQWASLAQWVSIPLLLLAVGVEFWVVSNPSARSVQTLLAVVNTGLSLLVLYALSLLLTERSQYRAANWAILATAWLTIINTVMLAFMWVMGGEEGQATQMFMIFVAGAVTLWLGVMLLRNEDPLWGIGRAYAVSTIASAVAMMSVILALLAIVPLIWNMVVGARLFAQAAKELHAAQAAQNPSSPQVPPDSGDAP
jgi:hypothetical protein